MNMQLRFVRQTITLSQYLESVVPDKLLADLKIIAADLEEEHGALEDWPAYTRPLRKSTQLAIKIALIAEASYEEGDTFPAVDQWESAARKHTPTTLARALNHGPISPFTKTKKAFELLAGKPALEAVKLLKTSLPDMGYEQLALKAEYPNGQLVSPGFAKRPEALERIRAARSPFMAASIFVMAFDEETYEKILENWEVLIETADSSKRQEIYSMIAGFGTPLILKRLFSEFSNEDALTTWRALMGYEHQLSFAEADYVLMDPAAALELPPEWLSALAGGREKPDIEDKRAAGVQLRPGVVGVSLRQHKNATQLVVRETPKQVSCVSLMLDLDVGCYMLRNQSLETSNFEVSTFIPVSGDYKVT